MRQKVEDVRVVPERVLRAVAVVEVPVHDRDPPCAASLRREGRDGDVVEEAEAHRAVGLRVVPGRADQGEAVGDLSGDDLRAELHEAAGGQQRGLLGLAPGVGVRVEVREITRGRAMNCGEKILGMDGEELFARCGTRGNALAAGREPFVLEPAPDRLDALFVLGMAVRRAVEQKALVVEQSGAHVSAAPRESPRRGKGSPDSSFRSPGSVRAKGRSRRSSTP